ncbi:MAG TPA: hypothetical protein ACFYED_04140 [Candidatus Tripitaka californicus]|uniref:hypothetical protein n=1 Tax=Candidatus Tripitaka californicus TaxID=3367616 RepID=UPI004025E421|nr:hypothetical protein [Planctomycetota bacterium]
MEKRNAENREQNTGYRLQGTINREQKTGRRICSSALFKALPWGARERRYKL